jgi:hypothetical protein
MTRSGDKGNVRKSDRVVAPRLDGRKTIPTGADGGEYRDELDRYLDRLLDEALEETFSVTDPTVMPSRFDMKDR